MAKSQSASTRKRGASREPRSVSPLKEPELSLTNQKSPRKPSRAKKQSKKAAKDEAVDLAAEDEDLEDELAAAIEEAEEEEAAEEAAEEIAALIAAAEELEDAEDALPADTVRVSVHQDVEQDGEVTTTHTSVKVDIPADAPDLELPKDTDGMVKMAAQLVEDARAVHAAEVEEVAATKMLKRKAEVLDEDIEGPEEVVEEIIPVPTDSVVNGDVGRPAKRTRVMVPAEEYRKERVKRRAVIGLSSALAVGVLVPFISNLF